MSVLELPDPDTSVLPRSPLRLVVCQVRHDRTFAAVDATRVVALHRDLVDRYPTITEAAVQAFGILAGPVGAQMTSSRALQGMAVPLCRRDLDRHDPARLLLSGDLGVRGLAATSGSAS